MINNIIRRDKGERQETYKSNRPIHGRGSNYKKFINSLKLYGKELKEAYEEVKSYELYLKIVENHLEEGPLFQAIGIKGGVRSCKTDLLKLLRCREILKGRTVFSDFTIKKLVRISIGTT